MGQRFFTTGVFLILFVAVLWVASSMLTQAIFVDLDYDRPMFLTYMNTCGFSLYIIVWAMGHACPSAEALPQKYKQISLAALCICPTWFFANVAYNASLAATSVSSVTVLSNTSSLWTLLLSRAVLGTPITGQNSLSVAVSIAGALFVVSDDGYGATLRHLIGDAFALGSAILYAVYTVLLQKMMPPNGHGEDITLLFGLMGLLGAASLWPTLVFMNRFNYEHFMLPPQNVIGAFAINNLLGTVLPQVLWARGVLMTSPLVATLGLSLTIPLSMVADGLWHHTTYTTNYFTGCILVGLGFVIANTDASWIYAAPGELETVIKILDGAKTAPEYAEEGELEPLMITVTPPLDPSLVV